MSAPTTYRQPVSRLWFMKKRTYFIFVLRELSSVFVGWFAVYLMVMLLAIGRGPAAYQNFLNWAASPVVVIVNVVALAFLILHTVTWFVLTPQAMEVRLGGRQVARVKMVNVAGKTVPAATVVRVGGRRVPSGVVIASQYAGLLVVSAFIIWLVLR
jgi:succinate dehydrogenase subunit C